MWRGVRGAAVGICAHVRKGPRCRENGPFWRVCETGPVGGRALDQRAGGARGGRIRYID